MHSYHEIMEFQLDRQVDLCLQLDAYSNHKWRNYPAHERSWIPELWPEPELELGQSSWKNKNKQESRDNNLKLGAKNPEE